MWHIDNWTDLSKGFKKLECFLHEEGSRTDIRNVAFWVTINQLPTWCTDYYLFIKYYSPLHVSSFKCSSSGGYSWTHAVYGNITHYESSWWPVGTQLEFSLKLCTDRSPRTPVESDYHMLHVYNYILLTMSTWSSKHVEENSILWINNNQCIKLVINI